ncbi:endocuticle structural glycoprotein SgAbd-8-like [Harmonia axyridis]|uniref:endocuticle structural glycoprotein SgAbd-8-like n=1 Tax=Harmonia axyridis TaxID=115357 RepID=UPI001E2784D7|nr:endocuticle structural glycoprotein SgAbd-8-like [Harmonia axyridis]
MDLSKFYICVCLIVAIEAISIPQYAYREVEDPAAAHKKAPIPILKQSFEKSKEGYQFSYETANGIHAEESGYIKNKGDEKHEVVVQQGTITYHDEHGKPISLTYIADEKGFRPQGAHLPTPPPIPEAILKSLEQNAHEEQQEQHLQQVHHSIAQKEPQSQEEYQYQQPEQQAVEYEQPQQELIQKEYQKQIQEQIHKQLREQQYQQPQYQQPHQEYQVQQYHQAGY